MMYEQNMRYLKEENLHMWSLLTEVEQNPFRILQGPKGTDYIQREVVEQRLTIHSMYNPMREAESIIESYREQIEAHEYILFVGAGLGYHIQYLIEKYPNKILYLYDPSVEIFTLTLHKMSIKDFAGIYVGDVSDNIPQLKMDIFAHNACIITLPIYNELFQTECDRLYHAQLEFFKEKKAEVQVGARFEKQWMYNALHNYHQMRGDISILHDVFKTYFRDKPVVLVSAGPSLDDEIDNLRQIKKNKSAFIFSVGSAIQTLLKHEIIPDAVCSYDPEYSNMETYEQVLKEKITSIPLFYASTLTSDLVEQWPGQKGYFLLNQDGLNPQIFCCEADEVILDAPTVATILLQIVFRWNVGKVILVGQNLALRNKKLYSESISYYQEVNEKGFNEKDLIEVQGVDGDTVYTEVTYKRMKDSLEACIRGYNRSDVVNTTQGGAHIEGTKFVDLSQVIQEYLTEEVVEENWFSKVISKVFEQEREERFADIKEKMEKFLKEKERFQKDFRIVKRKIEEIEQALIKQKVKQAEKYFSKYDQAMTKVESNAYYTGLIIPFIQVFLKQEARKVQEIMMRKQTNLEREQQKLDLVKRVVGLIDPVHRWMDQEITSLDFKGEVHDHC